MAPTGRVWTPTSRNNTTTSDAACITSIEVAFSVASSSCGGHGQIEGQTAKDEQCLPSLLRSAPLAQANASSCRKKGWRAIPSILSDETKMQKPEVEPAVVAQRSELGCGATYLREELLLARQRMVVSSECAGLGFVSRSVCVRFGAETPLGSSWKPKVGERTCSIAGNCASAVLQDTDELEQALNASAPVFVPQDMPGSGQSVLNAIAAKGHHPQNPSAPSTKSRQGFGTQAFHSRNPVEFVPRGFQDKAFTPQQRCPRSGFSKATPGLSASDMAFILGAPQPQTKQSSQMPSVSASAPEFIPRSRSDSTCSTQEVSLNAHASEFCPDSKPAQMIQEIRLSAAAADFIPQKMRSQSELSEAESVLSSAAAEFVPQKLRSQSESSEPESYLSSAAAEFVPQKLRSQSESSEAETSLNVAAFEFVMRSESESSEPESSLSSVAAEFVPRSLPISDKPLSVRDLAGRFYLPVGAC